MNFLEKLDMIRQSEISTAHFAEKELKPVLLIFTHDKENKLIYINTKINGYNSLPKDKKTIVSKYFLVGFTFLFGAEIGTSEDKDRHLGNIIDSMRYHLCQVDATSINDIIGCLIETLNKFNHSHTEIFELGDIAGFTTVENFIHLLKGYVAKGYINNDDIALINIINKEWKFCLADLDDLSEEF